MSVPLIVLIGFAVFGVGVRLGYAFAQPKVQKETGYYLGHCDALDERIAELEARR